MSFVPPSHRNSKYKTRMRNLQKCISVLDKYGPLRAKQLSGYLFTDFNVDLSANEIAHLIQIYSKGEIKKLAAHHYRNRKKNYIYYTKEDGRVRTIKKFIPPLEKEIPRYLKYSFDNYDYEVLDSNREV